MSSEVASKEPTAVLTKGADEVLAKAPVRSERQPVATLDGAVD